MPVATALVGDGRIRPGELPAGRYATTLHVGPYRSRTLPDLEAAQVAFAQWVSEQGLTVGHETARGTALVCAVQHFRVGPVDEPDPSRWETELAMKLA